MTARYKAILFDFDFTLGDSSRGIAESVNFALEQTGHPQATDIQINRLIGHTLRSIFFDLTGSVDDALYSQFRHYFNERAELVVTPSTVLYPGVIEMLIALKAQNKTLGIISTKYRRRLEEILDKFKLADHFSVVIGGEDVKQHKPHPEGLNLAIERLSLSTQEVIYIGDTVLDAQAAGASGIAFAAVLTGTTEPAAFAPYYPVGILQSVSALV